MKNTSNHDERIAKMTFASVYPHYLAKVEKKGRTKEELHQVIEWLTGYKEDVLKKALAPGPLAKIPARIFQEFKEKEIFSSLTQAHFDPVS